MADHYEVLSKAISELTDLSAGARNSVYNRIFNEIAASFRNAIPPAAESDFQQAVKDYRAAVARVEADLVKKGLVAPPDGTKKADSPPSAATSSATTDVTAQQAGQPQSQPAQKNARERGDLEFLPAALEILETPPSPIRIRLMVVICAFVVIGLSWSYFGHFDIVTIAQGKFQPVGRVNVVQPLETGKVKALNVGNGTHVKAGDVLVAMDASDTQAEVAAQNAMLHSLDAEIARRKTMDALIKNRQIDDKPAIAWIDEIAPDARAREQRVYDSDWSQLRSVILSLRAQRMQKLAERERIEATIVSQEAFVRTLQERVDMRTTLELRKAGSRANVIDALEKLNEQQTQLSIQKGQLKEAIANINVLDKEIEKSFDNAQADNNQRLLQAQRQRDETEQRLAKAKVRLANALLRSPNSGIVQGLSVINLGQVLSAGEQIMRIIPDDIGLEIEGYVQNKDIGFVKEGQPAIIKVDSFPFTKWGSLDAIVTKIARDAVPLPEASQVEGNPIQSNRQTGPGGTQRTQNLVYQITLRPAKDYIGLGDERVKMLPGMTVTLEIKTGRRRIISYLFTPLVEVGSSAMRER